MKRREADHYPRRASVNDQLADLPLGLGTPSNDPPVHQVPVTAHVRTLTGQAAIDAKQQEAERNLDARFADDLAARPIVYERIEEKVLALANGGETRISVKFVAELVRRELKLQVNNSFVSRTARWLIDRHPHLRELIEVRSLSKERAA